MITVKFGTEKPVDLNQANRLFLSAIEIGPLKYSLLGEPRHAGIPEDVLARHANIRRFATEEGFGQFCDHVQSLVASAKNDGQSPTIEYGESHFAYTTASGSASISIEKVDGGAWIVSGRAELRYLGSTPRRLQEVGFSLWFAE